MLESGKRIGLVAEFRKDSGKRLTLWSLTAIEEKPAHGGGTYLSRAIYDVDLSRKHGYLFHMSGGGGGRGPIPVQGIYFVSGAVVVEESLCTLVDGNDRPPWRSKRTRVIRERNRTRRLRVLPKAFGLDSGKDLLDWLEHNAIQEESVWCSECRDRVPGDELCEHTWWCNKIGWYSTPTERCGCKTREVCEDL